MNGDKIKCINILCKDVSQQFKMKTLELYLNLWLRTLAPMILDLSKLHEHISCPPPHCSLCNLSSSGPLRTKFSVCKKRKEKKSATPPHHGGQKVCQGGGDGCRGKFVEIDLKHICVYWMLRFYTYTRTPAYKKLVCAARPEYKCRNIFRRGGGG